MRQNDEFTLALIGAGNMGGAMLGGWLDQGLPAERILVVDPSPGEAMRAMMERSGVRHAAGAAGESPVDVMILAVKPQVMADVLPGLMPLAGANTVAVSVAAGITIAQLSRGLEDRCAIIRSMPNTPSLVKRGMTVCCADERVSDVQRDRVDALLKAIGKVEWVADEGLIDAVTAVSGSGPAYVFLLAECMAQAGIEAGLDPQLAMTLARETVAGAGELLIRSPETPSRLRQNVTSPNGTTAAALEVLMGEDGMGPLMKAAVAAAKKRSQELAGR